MLKKILAALDGSENAEKVVPWVKQMASRETALVVLLRVVRTDELAPVSPEETLREAREYLQGIERELNYAGIPCTVLVRKGEPSRVIIRAAERERCDLILMSTRGGSPVERWAMGGVTERVLRQSPVPVLVVRSQTILPRQGHVRRVIIPVDGSSLGEAAVPWGGRLARLLKAKLVLLHVTPAGPAGRQTSVHAGVEELRGRMEQTCRDLQRRGVKATFNLQRGDAADRILAFADQNDLVVTTTHGFGGFKRWVFGSVAEKLIHEASIPVLVYKTASQVYEMGRRIVPKPA